MSVRVGQALRRARLSGIDALDAQRLLAHRLQRSRAWLIAHDDTSLDDACDAAFTRDCERRAAGVPLAYLVGEKEFHGLPLRVTPAVLVPRPDTETLVDWALDLLRLELAQLDRPAVVDLGTGSGAIAIAVALRCPRARVVAVDDSADALAVARTNAAHHRTALDLRLGSWWSALRDGERFDLVLSNPPYIAEGDAHLDALVHEPRRALVAPHAGMADIEAIVAGAGAHLRPGGWLLLEHGHEQAAAVTSLLRHGGFDAVATRLDLGASPRCTGGRWPG